MVSFRVGTWNIGGGQTEEPSSIDNRRAAIVQHLEEHPVDLLGLQEFSIRNLDFLHQLPKFAQLVYELGIDEGNGMFPGTVARSENHFQCLRRECIWLNKTPERKGKSWDEDVPRAVCKYLMADLQDSGREVWLYNTHLDHIGIFSRMESIKMILEFVDRLEPYIPVIITGDFNFDHGETWLYDLIRQAGFADSYASAHQGDSRPSTVHRYPEFAYKGPGKKSYVDIIWCRNLRVISATIVDVRASPVFASDHQFVIAELDYLT